MRKSLSGIFEYWKSFRFINLIQSVYLWVNRMRRELRPCGLKLNVLFSSVWIGSHENSFTGRLNRTSSTVCANAC